MKKKLIAGAVAAGAMIIALAGGTPAMAADNLIGDGSFAEATIGLYSPGQSIPGWTVKSENGYYPGVGLSVQKAPGDNDDQQAAVMGTITQAFPTEVGKTYQVSYDLMAAGTIPGLSNNPAYDGGAQATVSVADGTTVNEAKTNIVMPMGSYYNNLTFAFTATGTTSILSISTDTAARFFDVNVTEVPVEDSPIMAMSIAGGLGVAGVGAAAAQFVSRKKKQELKK